jgi:hypothetical protein
VADDFITIVDVVQGEYSNKTNKLIKEKRTFYYFHLVKIKGWKIYMITSAALD